MTRPQIMFTLALDGKDATVALDLFAESLKNVGRQAKTSGEGVNTGFTSAARGVRSISEQLDGAKQALIAYFSVNKAMDVAGWVTQQAQDLKQLDARLKAVTTTATEYAAAQRLVFETANRWGASVNETAGAFARLNPTVAQMGGTSVTTARMLDGLGASLRLSGATTVETSSVMLQFAQAMGSGRVGGDEFRSMMENAQPLMRAVADQLHISTGELRQWAEEGKLTSSVFANAMMPAIEGMVAKAKDIPPTIGQAMAVLKNNALRDFGEEFKGAGDLSSEAVMKLAGSTKELAAAAGATVDMLGSVAKAALLAAGLMGIGALVGATVSATAALTGGAGLIAGLGGLGIALASVQVSASLVIGAVMSKIAGLSLAAKGGLIGLALWGGWELGSFIGSLDAVRDKLSDVLTPAFKLFDKIAGRNAGDSGAVGATVTQAASQASQSADNARRLSSAGEYSALTKDLKWREKVVAEYNTKLANLNRSYADKWAETSPSNRPQLEQDHRKALSAMMEERKAAIESSSDVKAAAEANKRSGESSLERLKQIELLKAETVKQSQDTLKSLYTQGVITESEYLQQEVTLDLQALASKRDVVEQELTLAKRKKDGQTDVVKFKGQLALLDEQMHTAAIKYGNDYAEMLSKQADARNKIIEKNNAASDKALDAGQKEIDQLISGNQALRDHIESIGLTAAQTAQLTVKRLESAVAMKQLELVEAQSIDGNEARANQLEREIALLQERQNLTNKSNAKEAVKAALDDQKKLLDSFEQSAHAVWTNVLQGGQDLWSKLRNTAKTIFFDWLYQLAAKPFVLSVGMSILGTGAQANTPGAAASSARSTASSAGSWLTDFGGTTAFKVNDFGEYLVNHTSGPLNSFGSSLMENAGKIGDWSKTVGDGMGYLNSVVAISKGKWGEGIGSAVGTYFGGPIGSVIGSTIGKAVDRLFGSGGVPKVDGGYNSGNGTTLISQNHWTKEGGYQGGAGDTSVKAVVDGLATNYKNLVELAGGKAGTLTTGAYYATDPNGRSNTQLLFESSLNGKQIYNRNTDTGGYENVGKSPEELKAAIDLASTKTLVEALKATDLGGPINEYLKTITTSSASIEDLNKALGNVEAVSQFKQVLIGLPFKELGQMSVEASAELIQMAGGLANLSGSLKNYFDLFYSGDEKLAAQKSALNQQLATMGKSAPGADANLRDWYKSEVARLGAMDLSVEANAKAYASFLQLASSVDAVAKADEELLAKRQSWQDKLDVLMGKTTDTEIQLRNDLASTTDESTRAIVRQVYAETARQKAAADAETARQKAAADAETARVKGISDAKSALDRAIAAEKTRAQAVLDAAQESVTAFSSLFDLLKSQVADLYGQVDSTSALSASAGAAFIAQALATANATGYLPDQAALSESISSVRAGFDKTLYASKFESDRARLVLAGQLDQLKGKAGEQLSSAEQQLRVAKDQLTTLDGILEAAQKQIDAINGVDTSVLSVADAVRKLSETLGVKASATSSKTTTATSTSTGASFGGGSGAATATKAEFYKPSNSGLGLASGGTVAVTDSAEIQRYRNIHAGAVGIGADPVALAAGAKSAGVTQDELAIALGLPADSVKQWFAAAGVSAFENGGLHSGGWRIVGERGPELEFTGAARYWDASTSTRMLASAAGSSNDSSSANELRQLRDDQRAQTLAMVGVQREMQRLFETWDRIGLPPTRAPVGSS